VQLFINVYLIHFSTQECKISDVSNFVIEETDVEQLVEERNSLIQIAYDVCCLYMDIEKVMAHLLIINMNAKSLIFFFFRTLTLITSRLTRE
jgi:hypothetical protein